MNPWRYCTTSTASWVTFSKLTRFGKEEDDSERHRKMFCLDGILYKKASTVQTALECLKNSICNVSNVVN